MENKYLSVITINYNDAEGLKKTMDSVVNQNWKGFEYLVIDGGSSDESPILMEAYKSNIDYSVSEKDKGIYNAMNKGIKAAKGEYLLFLNSGDYFENEFVLEKIFSNNRYTDDLLYGFIKTIKEGKTELKRPPEHLSMDYLLNHSLPHPATFFKKELFEKYGYYNESNRIVSDWEFNLKVIAIHNVSYKYLNELVSVFNLNGISSQQAFEALRKKEGKEILERLFSPIMIEYILENNRLKTELRQLRKSKIIQWAMKIRNAKNR